MQNLFNFFRYLFLTVLILGIYDIVTIKSRPIIGPDFFSTLFISLGLSLLFLFLFWTKNYSLNTNAVSTQVLEKRLQEHSYYLSNDSKNNVRIYKGNLSYSYFCGDIKVEVIENQLHLTGSKFVINKLLNT